MVRSRAGATTRTDQWRGRRDAPSRSNGRTSLSLPSTFTRSSGRPPQFALWTHQVRPRFCPRTRLFLLSSSFRFSRRRNVPGTRAARTATASHWQTRQPIRNNNDKVSLRCIAARPLCCQLGRFQQPARVPPRANRGVQCSRLSLATLRLPLARQRERSPTHQAVHNSALAANLNCPDVDSQTLSKENDDFLDNVNSTPTKWSKLSTR